MASDDFVAEWPRRPGNDLQHMQLRIDWGAVTQARGLERTIARHCGAR